MLLEDLLALPVGTRVFGEIAVPTMVPGVIASSGGGTRLIRWDDGYSTIPLGKVQEYDEYIAAHTDLQSTRAVRKAEQHNEGAEAGVRSYIARVKRA